MEYQVELCEIVKNYKAFRAVDHINLQIKKGEIVSLLGASGCGKTTTLRMIAGLIIPSEGTVKIEGVDATRVPPYKRDVAMVFQNYALFPHLNVFENVVYGLRNRKIRDKDFLRQRAKDVLSIVQLEGAEERNPRQLSVGQQQRVSLARALIVNPKVMLFDEPLSNLDAKLRVQTRTEIRNLLKQMNITALYVTHDQEEALTISDRIAVMNRGRIEQIALPTELYNAPATKFVADFIGHANLFEGVVSLRNKEVVVKTENEMEIVCATTSQNRTVGERKNVLVRPENIRLSAQPNFECNCFPGRIKERSFLGSVVRYMVQLPSGQLLEVEAHSSFELPESCSDVFVSFQKEYAVLVG